MMMFLIIFYCFCVSRITGFIVPENITTNQVEHIMLSSKNDINDVNDSNENIEAKLISDLINDVKESKSGLEISNNKINETELYETGHTVKENNERSYVYINQKYKSPWFDSRRPAHADWYLPSENLKKHLDFSNSLFSEFETFNNNVLTSRVTNHKQTKAEPDDIKYAPVKKGDRKEYLELLKKPLLRPVSKPNNDNIEIRRPDKEFFRSNDNIITPEHYNFHEGGGEAVLPSLAALYQHRAQKEHEYRVSAINQYQRSSPQFGSVKNNYNNNLNEKVSLQSLEDETNIEEYIRNAIKKDDREMEYKINGNRYDCYNSTCRTVFNKRVQALNNGLRRGPHCICETRAKIERPGREDTRSFQEVTVPTIQTTETSDDYKVAKDSSNLSKLSDELTQLVRRNL